MSAEPIPADLESLLIVDDSSVQRQHAAFGLAADGGRTVGCIVNRVDTAVQLAARLRGHGPVARKVGGSRGGVGVDWQEYVPD